MKLTPDGWAEQEHANESVPAAMHNAMKMQMDRELPGYLGPISFVVWAERIAEMERQRSIVGRFWPREV